MTDYGKEHLFDVGFESMAGLPAKRLNQLFRRKRAGEFMGIPIVTDPSIPEGEIRIVNDGPCIPGCQYADCTCNVDRGKRR